jgi:hypothetical protein
VPQREIAFGRLKKSVVKNSCELIKLADAYLFAILARAKLRLKQADAIVLWLF